MAETKVPIARGKAAVKAETKVPFASGKAAAMTAFLAQGGEQVSKGGSRRPGFRYTSGPMKGKTQDQAVAAFEGKWAGASDSVKNKYAAYGKDSLAPSENEEGLGADFRPQESNNRTDGSSPDPEVGKSSSTFKKNGSTPVDVAENMPMSEVPKAGTQAPGAAKPPAKTGNPNSRPTQGDQRKAGQTTVNPEATASRGKPISNNFAPGSNVLNPKQVAMVGADSTPEEEAKRQGKPWPPTDAASPATTEKEKQDALVKSMAGKTREEQAAILSADAKETMPPTSQPATQAGTATKNTDDSINPATEKAFPGLQARINRERSQAPSPTTPIGSDASVVDQRNLAVSKPTSNPDTSTPVGRAFEGIGTMIENAATAAKDFVTKPFRPDVEAAKDAKATSDSQAADQSRKKSEAAARQAEIDKINGKPPASPEQPAASQPSTSSAPGGPAAPAPASTSRPVDDFTPGPDKEQVGVVRSRPTYAPKIAATTATPAQAAGAQRMMERDGNTPTKSSTGFAIPRGPASQPERAIPKLSPTPGPKDDPDILRKDNVAAANYQSSFSGGNPSDAEFNSAKTGQKALYDGASEMDKIRLVGNTLKRSSDQERVFQNQVKNAPRASDPTKTRVVATRPATPEEVKTRKPIARR